MTKLQTRPPSVATSTDMWINFCTGARERLVWWTEDEFQTFYDEMLAKFDGGPKNEAADRDHESGCRNPRGHYDGLARQAHRLWKRN